MYSPPGVGCYCRPMEGGFSGQVFIVSDDDLGGLLASAQGVKGRCFSSKNDTSIAFHYIIIIGMFDYVMEVDYRHFQLQLLQQCSYDTK